jgi:hypothetical protein
MPPFILFFNYVSNIVITVIFVNISEGETFNSDSCQCNIGAPNCPMYECSTPT